ncbi:oxidoreductase, partial [Mycobacterium sp. ITM-2017-0098]
MASYRAALRPGGVVMITAVDDQFDQALLRQAFGCFP